MRLLCIQKLLRVLVTGDTMLKAILKKIIHYIEFIRFFYQRNINILSSRLLFTRIKIDKKSMISATNSYIAKTSIFVSGEENLVTVVKAKIERCEITINGTRNRLILEENVSLRKANIIIRGSDNQIKIGRGTSFGTVRIINVGKDNSIQIGEDCLFSDYIEIWGSDTHSIYDKEGNFINPEMPIHIGNKVWIGSHVTILKGVIIDDGAIIGMNSMVTKYVERKTVNAGNPLRVLKRNVTWSNAYAPLVSKSSSVKVE